MNDAKSIIKELNLEPHPEGGHFVECFKNKYISIIYYLLQKNEKSHWHRLSKNENLHFYKGDPLNIYISENGFSFSSFILGEKRNFNYTIKAGNWFAMKSSGEYSLIGCTVSPAFDYKDFELAPPDWKPKYFDIKI
ncbi:MAG: cupin [Pelagibacteraceae bacterium]|nr:cupin [Pelagibacteraceae bacterium]|tara:strand:+ start:9599 stop:10006 length:408 start_codon:yes stop_codon:yes gene_type:complete